jgi:hypothetical protein
MKRIIKVLAWLPSQALKLTKSLPLKYAQACVYTYILGVYRGYSFENITFMINQITHETGHGLSNAIESYNNTNGMNCVSTRPTTQTSCTENAESLGIYSDIYDSVIDRFMWDDYWGFDTLRTNDSYIEAAANRYHTSSSYSSIVSSLGTSVPNASRLVSLVVVPMELLLPIFLYKYAKTKF